MDVESVAKVRGEIRRANQAMGINLSPDHQTQIFQALCDALDAAGYRPTGWAEPERLK